MRLHTSLYSQEVRAALRRAQDKGRITADVHFTVWTPGRSRTHPHAYEIQLGTYDQYSLPAGYRDQRGSTMHVRRYRNSNHGEAEWAATWHEWGWLITEIFEADPAARWGHYQDAADFHTKTDGQFRPCAIDPRCSQIWPHTGRHNTDLPTDRNVR